LANLSKKKCFEHMLFSKVIIIAFAHKKSINIILFYVSECGVIINFVNLFRKLPVSRGLSPLIAWPKEAIKNFNNSTLIFFVL